MEFLCPNCQKMLTVPDQYAGTKMKCPLCASAFTAPALAPPPGSVPAPSVPGPFSSPTPPAPPAPMPPPSLGTDRPAPPPPPTPGDYRHGFGFSLKPKVVLWIAPAALLLIFVMMMFCNWVGMYPEGYGVYTQGAGGAAFAWFNPDTVWSPVWAKVVNEKVGTDPPVPSPVPGVLLRGDREPEPTKLEFSFLMWLYLPLFLLALVVSVAAAVLPLVTLRLPPQVEQLKPWRWVIAGGVALLAFLLLCGQLLWGFSLEQKVRAEVEAKLQPIKDKAGTPPTKEDLDKINMARGSLLGAQGLEKTTWFRLTVLLHIVAVLAAGLQFWLDWRVSRGKPIPRLDVRW